MKRAAFMVAGAGLLLTACGGETGPSIDACENFTVEVTTLDRFQQPAKVFGTNEVVRFQQTARNNSNREQIVNGANPGSCTGPFSVIDSQGKDLYADPRDPAVACAAVVTPFQLKFAPLETKTYSVDWNTPRNGEYRGVASGSYTLKYFSGLDKCGSAFNKSTVFTMQ